MQSTSDLSADRYATREIEDIPPYTNLVELREEATESANAALQAGALAAIARFDPTVWRQLLFCLWQAAPIAPEGTQIYAVGHVSRARSE